MVFMHFFSELQFFMIKIIQSLPLYHSPVVPLPPLWWSHCRSMCTNTHMHFVKFPSFSPIYSHSTPNLPGMQLVLEQSSWVVDGYWQEIMPLPKSCSLQAYLLDTWQRLSDWSWLAIHSRQLGTHERFLWKAHFITYLLTACQRLLSSIADVN